MKNTRKHIDDFFKEKLGGYSEVPPADAWNDLDARLDSLVPQAPPTSPYRWIGHAAIVSVIAVLSVSVVKQFVDKKNNSNEIVKEQTINKLETTNSTVTINNSADGVAVAKVPEMKNEGQEAGAGSREEQAANGKALAMSVTGNGEQKVGAEGKKEGQKVGTGSRGMKNANIAKGKQANYAPYNNGLDNGLANVGAKVSSPAKANTYNSSIDEKYVEQNVQDVKVNGNVNQSVASENKNNPQAAKTEVVIPKKDEVKPVGMKKEEAKKLHQKPDFARWQAGVKGGYERGFNNMVSTKYVITPYLQFNISKKVSIMAQPGVKYANAPLRTIGTPQAYYTVNGDGKVVDNGSDISVVFTGTGMDTTYNARYRYTQSHDSIVKTNKAGGTYMEYELPVVFKYNVSKKMAVYGGPNMVFSQMKGVKEHTYTKTGIVRTVDTLISGEVMASAPAIGNIITYNGSPFSDYNGPLYPAPQDNRIRFGAIVGFSYEYSDRWLLDALIQQSPAPKDIRGGYNINAPLSATYFRLSVGYKLTK